MSDEAEISQFASCTRQMCHWMGSGDENEPESHSVSASISCFGGSPHAEHYSDKYVCSMSVLPEYRGISMSKAAMRLRHYAARCRWGREVRLVKMCFAPEYWLDCRQTLAWDEDTCKDCPRNIQATPEAAIRVHNRWVRTSKSRSEGQP